MKKILIVDDTKTIHMFLKSITKEENFDFKDAYNGQEALDLLKEESVDLVLLDWEMPVMNGPQTLERLVEDHPDLPVIMMTTKNSFEDVSSMIQAGAKEYIMKPFTKDILLEKINGLDEEEFGYAI